MKHSAISLLDRGLQSPDVVEQARQELALLHLRRRRLASGRMTDGHWGILLDLYVAHAEGRSVLTKDLEDSSGVSSTALLRYLDALEERGMIERTSHEHDARATCIRPTAKGLERIASILREATAFSRLLTASEVSIDQEPLKGRKTHG